MSAESSSALATHREDPTAPPPSGSLFKWCIRTSLVGVSYGLALGALATISPLVRLSLNENNFKQLAPRIMSDFFTVNFFASAASYAWFIERNNADNVHVKDGFLPYLGPVTAQIPSLSCLVVSHCFYPGMWAVFNERTWRDRCREGTRLSIKTLVAFSAWHVPGVMAVGFVVGCVVYPSKWSKLRRQERGKQNAVSIVTNKTA
jgi:hypothetical protein